MSIMKRVRDISVATLNDRLERAEDPVKLIDSYLTEQSENIRQSEALYQQCLQHAGQLKQQFTQAGQYRDKREEQALLALKAGEESLAKLALQEKMLYEEKYDNYKKLYDQAAESITELSTRLDELKADYSEVYNKRQYYVARMQSVQLQQRMNERMGFGSTRVGERMFERMEDRISTLEIEARTLSDVRRQGQQMLYEAGVGVKSLLETELAKLKTKLEQEGEETR